MKARKFTRRTAVGILGSGAVSLLAAACVGQAPPAPPATPAPAPPPTAQPTGAAASVVQPTPLAKAPLGNSLIGKLEGPEIVTDPASFPKTFQEAPMLVELVKAGKLPPVEQRLPEEPLIVKPIHEIGRYGGTWRRAFTGPADNQNGTRVAGGDKLLFWHATRFPEEVPNLARAWTASADGRVFTVSLRKGTRWSDGEPFTADDILFWYEDIFLNKDLAPSKSGYFSINGKEGAVVKVDDSTVEFRFPDPYPLWLEVMASTTDVMGGHAQYGAMGAGGFAPKHYLQQFHPTYVGTDKAQQVARDAQFDNWAVHFRAKNGWHLNPDLPVVTPWKTVTPANTSSWVLERNPYSIWVDSAGNQLPYIDKIQLTLAENLEIVNLRAIAGEYDVQERHLSITKVPVFLANEEQGNYKLSIDPADNGSDAAFRFNLSFDNDPEIAKWVGTADFRRALSLGIDRGQIKEAMFVGLGTPGSAVVADSSPYNPGPEYRTLWSTLDPSQANAILDRIGLDQKDGDGFRQRTDGRGRLQLEITTVAAAFIPSTQIGEMIKEQWKRIGVWADVVENERGLYEKRIGANETHLQLLENSGSDELFMAPGNQFPFIPSSSVGPEFGKWFASGGKAGKEPKDPELLKAYDLFKQAFGVSFDERVKLGKEIWRIAIEQQWVIGIVGFSGAFMGIRVTSNRMGNVPARQLNNMGGNTPNLSRPTTFYFKS